MNANNKKLLIVTVLVIVTATAAAGVIFIMGNFGQTNRVDVAKNTQPLDGSDSASEEDQFITSEEEIPVEGQLPQDNFGEGWERIDVGRHEEELYEVGRGLRSGVVQLGFPGRTEADFESTGAGFVVHKNGLILTNAHVIEGFDSSMSVRTYDGTVIQASILARSEDLFERDIAILKAQGDLGNVKVLEFAPTGSLNESDVLFNIGHPAIFGDWVIKGGGYMGEYTGDLIIDMPGSVGDSGSPLFNMNGRVVGIIHGATNLDSLPVLGPKDDVVVWWGNFVNYHRAVGAADSNQTIRDFLTEHLDANIVRDIFGS